MLTNEQLLETNARQAERIKALEAIMELKDLITIERSQVEFLADSIRKLILIWGKDFTLENGQKYVFQVDFTVFKTSFDFRNPEIFKEVDE